MLGVRIADILGFESFWEETGLRGAVERPLDVPVDLDVPAFYLHLTVAPGTLRLRGPEVDRASEANTYTPQWVLLSELDRHNLVPVGARTAIALALAE